MCEVFASNLTDIFRHFGHLVIREYLGYRHLLLTARENELIVILILIGFFTDNS